MKHLLLTTIAAVVLVGCGEAQPPEPPDSSIHAAALEGNIEAVKQHLASGADVNTKDSIGTTPLFLAVIKGQKETVELLIAEGADVNAKHMGGWTPLHRASGNGHKEIVELLIDKGADVNAKIALGPNQGKTPLDWAIGRRRIETADLLRTHGGKYSKIHLDRKSVV